MTRREIVFTIIGVMAVLLSMYQCGASADDRQLRRDALDSLAVSREERDAVRSQLRQERMLRELGDLQVKGYADSIATLTERSAVIAGQARTIRDRATEQLADVRRQHARDTASMVPRARLEASIDAATGAVNAAALADAARSILADSVGFLRARSDSIEREQKKRILTAIDSVTAHLAREDTRQPVITAGVEAGSDRCGWGPWKLIPCVTRKVAFVGGAVLGAAAVKYGADAIQLLKRGA